MRKFIEMMKRNRPKLVGFTPAFQSYISAGDESEAFCPTCDCMPLEDGTNFCPYCGQRLEWDDYPSQWYFIKLRIRKILRIKDRCFDFDWGEEETRTWRK